MALRSKIKEADARHRQDGKRYFVIPTHDGTLQTLNIEEAITLKKQGVLPSDFSNKMVYRYAYYWSDTTAPHSASPGRMPAIEQRRRRSYFYSWYSHHHK